MDGHIRCWGRVALATLSSNGPGDSKGKLLVQTDANATKPLYAHFDANTPEAISATELLLFPVFLYPFHLEDNIIIFLSTIKPRRFPTVNQIPDPYKWMSLNLQKTSHSVTGGQASIFKLPGAENGRGYRWTGFIDLPHHWQTPA